MTDSVVCYRCGFEWLWPEFEPCPECNEFPYQFLVECYPTCTVQLSWIVASWAAADDLAVQMYHGAHVTTLNGESWNPPHVTICAIMDENADQSPPIWVDGKITYPGWEFLDKHPEVKVTEKEGIKDWELLAYYGKGQYGKVQS